MRRLGRFGILLGLVGFGGGLLLLGLGLETRAELSFTVSLFALLIGTLISLSQVD